jgi:CheY-like chemotaxis protein
MPLDRSHTNAILIVEDDDALRANLAQLLVREGYLVMEAANGCQALDKLHGKRLPALIVLDLSMPVMNGWEFRKRQLQDPELAAIPVVVWSLDADSAQSVDIRAAAYLSKASDVNTLLAVISSLLAAPSAG